MFEPLVMLSDHFAHFILPVSFDGHHSADTSKGTTQQRDSSEHVQTLLGHLNF